MKMFIKQATDVLLGGGVVACPTEGVYGLSCMPDDVRAVLRVLDIKRRDPAKGLILIASVVTQLEDWIETNRPIPSPDPAHPTTWIVKAAAHVSPLVRGRHEGIAVRITTNPVARDLCESVSSPIVSTSANVAGESPARNRFVLRRKFGLCVDYIVPGDCGPASGPSEIRDLETGKVLRAGAA